MVPSRCIGTRSHLLLHLCLVKQNSPHGRIINCALRAALGGSGSERSDHWAVANLFLMITHVRASQAAHCLCVPQEHPQSGSDSQASLASFH